MASPTKRTASPKRGTGSARGSAHTSSPRAARPHLIPGTEVELVDERLAALLEPISSVRADPANPRRTRNLAALVEIMRRFGYSDPIVVARDTKLIEAGHQRLDALASLGATHVPVLWTRHGKIDAAAYNVAHNRSSEIVAEWDDDALRQLLRALSAEDGTKAIGYTAEELAKKLDPQPRTRRRITAHVTCPKCRHEFKA